MLIEPNVNDTAAHRDDDTGRNMGLSPGMRRFSISHDVLGRLRFGCLGLSSAQL